MSYLGTVFSNLPRQGVNLRLYTIDPNADASKGQWRFNTGHYDASLSAGPCSADDPQGFSDWDSMAAYATGRGEMMVLVDSPDDVPGLCAYKAPNMTPPPGYQRMPDGSVVWVGGGNQNPPPLPDVPAGYQRNPDGTVSVVVKTPAPSTGTPATGTPYYPPPPGTPDTGKPEPITIGGDSLSTTYIVAGAAILALLFLRR
jgi:hypothetical protein